jgi:hypothetical protein
VCLYQQGKKFQFLSWHNFRSTFASYIREMQSNSRP